MLVPARTQQRHVSDLLAQRNLHDGE
jgi:hypothetical protein